MPLKLICGKCGKLLFQSSMKRLHLAYNDASIPAIIRDKRGSKCPGCGRKFTEKDLENWTLEITGLKATACMQHSLHVRHGEPKEFSVVKVKKRGRPRR